jgi:hypothetical protein
VAVRQYSCQKTDPVGGLESSTQHLAPPANLAFLIISSFLHNVDRHEYFNLLNEFVLRGHMCSKVFMHSKRVLAVLVYLFKYFTFE